MEEFWCHICKQQVSTPSPTQFNCQICQSSFIQLIQDPDHHPRNFIPYQPSPSFNQLITDLLSSNSIRSIRYSTTQLSSQTDNMDQIISQLMQNDPNRYGPPPASQSAIDSLPLLSISNSVLKQRGKFTKGLDECGARIDKDRVIIQCSVCKDQFKINEQALDMPCKHLFHKGCLLPWLRSHNNCPECRFQLRTDDLEYEERTRIQMVAWFLLSLVFADFPEQEDVLVLSESNFDQALNTYPDLLVEFYAPWCGHCKKLAPQYAKAAVTLKKNDPPIRIAKVDATQNQNLAQKFGIQGYPTLIYFLMKTPTEYTGGRTEDAIVSWVKKKAGPPVDYKESLADLKTAIETTEVAAVLFSQKGSAELDMFEFIAKTFDGPSFFLSTDPASLTEYGISEPSIVVFKKFDDRRNDYKGNFNTLEITQFIEDAKVPWALPFDDKAIELIFKSQSPALFFLRSETDHQKFLPTLQTLGKELKKEIFITYADISTGDNMRLGEFMGIRPAQMPVALILDTKTQSKYKNEGEVSQEGLKNFISQWRNKSLSPFLKSEQIPSDDFDNGVRVLVGKNFESIVYDSTKDVFVQFYAPWCGHCKKLAPEYEKLATEFSSTSSVIIAKIDSTANEVSGINIGGFPTLKFFPANNKNSMEFEGDRSVQGMKDYILKNAHTLNEGKERTDL